MYVTSGVNCQIRLVQLLAGDARAHAAASAAPAAGARRLRSVCHTTHASHTLLVTLVTLATRSGTGTLGHVITTTQRTTPRPAAVSTFLLTTIFLLT